MMKFSFVITVMVDNDGFDYKYATTDLNNAISIRDTKTINNY